MIDILLTLLIGALLAFIYLKDRQHNKQINALIKAVMAKSSTEYINMTLADNTEIKHETPAEPLGPLDDDLISVGGATDELFDLAIDKQLNPDVEVEEDSI